MKTNVRRTDRSPSLAPGIAAAVLLVALSASACGGGTGEPGSQKNGEASGAQLATAEFRVDGMTCGGCALATEMAVRKVEGVESVDAEYDDATGEGRCTVEYRPAVVDVESIVAAIRGAGFSPVLASGPPGS